MLLLSFAVLIPLYALVARWAHRTGGAGRLWAVGFASTAVVAALASMVAAKSAPVGAGSGIAYMAALYGLPILCATLAAALARSGRVAAAIVGGAVGVVVVLAVSMFVLTQVRAG